MRCAPATWNRSTHYSTRYGPMQSASVPSPTIATFRTRWRCWSTIDARSTSCVKGAWPLPLQRRSSSRAAEVLVQDREADGDQDHATDDLGAFANDGAQRTTQHHTGSDGNHGG